MLWKISLKFLWIFGDYGIQVISSESNKKKEIWKWRNCLWPSYLNTTQPRIQLYQELYPLFLTLWNPGFSHCPTNILLLQPSAINNVTELLFFHLIVACKINHFHVWYMGMRNKNEYFISIPISLWI